MIRMLRRLLHGILALFGEIPPVAAEILVFILAMSLLAFIKGALPGAREKYKMLPEGRQMLVGACGIALLLVLFMFLCTVRMPVWA